LIYTCPVKDCGVMYEMGEDHQAEPCLSCWRQGWRTDAFGNVWQELPRQAPHPADDVVAE